MALAPCVSWVLLLLLGLFLIVCNCVCVWACTCEYSALGGQRYWIPQELELWPMWHGCENPLRSYEEQYMLFIAEPFLQPLVFYCLKRGSHIARLALNLALNSWFSCFYLPRRHVLPWCPALLLSFFKTAFVRFAYWSSPFPCPGVCL